ncbi:MAG TPA: PP2C family protein-serine/threonine phosphatase [Candidatus Acidoferrum sp.]|nr:PP2C family protein-serine/threonine phosphatase [Candidatus Acidoferrum sp.]
MKKKLSTWLAGVRSAFPAAFSPYWHMLPLGRMKMFLAGYFFLGAAGGFAFDLLQLNASRVGGGFFWPVLVGTGAAALRAAGIKRFRLIPPLFLLVVLTAWLGYWASHVSLPLPVPVAVHRRVLFDAIGILVSIGFGTRFLLFFAGTEGLASVRMQTELSLAHGIQATLVPTISFQNASFELYGKSIPSTEMGGDLIDVIESNGGLVACVADISGHGLPAGQLMGMLKTAMRLAMQFRQMPVATLESVDRVLPDLKEREMFATVALLRFDGSREAEYALAGHPPILHYRHGSDTVRLSMEQLPLGLIPGGSYASKRVIYSPRDLFLMVTDGITEVTNARDEEFGLTRLQDLLTRHATRALPEIWDLIMREVRQYGLQQDDQSLLLLRVLDPAIPLAT